MKYNCPVCGASLIVARTFSGDYLYRVNSTTGELEATKEESDSQTTIGCSADETHQIGFDLECAIMDGIPV